MSEKYFTPEQYEEVAKIKRTMEDIPLSDAFNMLNKLSNLQKEILLRQFITEHNKIK